MKRLDDFIDEWIYYPLYSAANVRTDPRNRLAHFGKYMGDLIVESVVYGSAAYATMGGKAASVTVATNTTLRMAQFLKNHLSC